MKSGRPETEPTTPDAVFSRSMAAFQRGDTEGAILWGDKLLEISNQAIPALVWATRLRLEARRWNEVIAFGTRVVDMSPGVCGLMAHAYEAIGNLEVAQGLFARACQEQPDNPAWFYHNASVLSRLFRDFESMEALERAIDLTPTPDPAALMLLAPQQLGFGLAEKALKTVERAIAANPRVEGGQSLAARCLMALGRFNEAGKRWEKLIASDPRNATYSLQRAIALVRHGQFNEGIDALNQMLARNPRFVPALAQIATAKRISEEDHPLVERMESILADRSLHNDDRIALSYALGKAYDNLGSFGPAMAHFDEGNALQFRAIESTGGFDREGYAANMDLRMKAYSREVIDQNAPSGNRTEAPIFVLGVIRSGTTLAEQILAAHPQVAGAGELNFWINTDLRLIDYERETLHLSVLREAADAYLRLLGGYAVSGAVRVVDKQPGNLILAGALHIAFPNARIIHMRRHPVDTAVSIWTTHVRTSTRFVNHKGNIVHAFRQHDRLMQHWRETIPSNRFLDVSYEELVTDRENQTRRILEFCELPWDEACLSPERNQKFVITPSLWQVRQPVYRTSINRWRNYEPWLGEFRELLP